MRLDAFRALVAQLAREVPGEFYDGILEVTVSPRTVAHPTRDDTWTMGECIPVSGEAGDDIRSRVVLYHGSFVALAAGHEDFDWVAEARETLQHELRHHIEWRAHRADFEALDRAAEENFARQDGEPFDPLFFLEGEPAGPGLYRVEDDWFLDHVVAALPARVTFAWGGRSYTAELSARPPDRPSARPPDRLPAYVVVDGLPDPPPGELTLVFRRKPGFRDLFRRATPAQYRVRASPASEAPSPADTSR